MSAGEGWGVHVMVEWKEGVAFVLERWECAVGPRDHGTPNHLASVLRKCCVCVCVCACIGEVYGVY